MEQTAAATRSRARRIHHRQQQLRRWRPGWGMGDALSFLIEIATWDPVHEGVPERDLADIRPDREGPRVDTGSQWVVFPPERDMEREGQPTEGTDRNSLRPDREGWDWDGTENLDPVRERDWDGRLTLRALGERDWLMLRALAERDWVMLRALALAERLREVCECTDLCLEADDVLDPRTLR